VQEIIEALASGGPEERKAASDQLAQRAEGGADLTPALPALGEALADPEEQVRIDVAWTCAFLADGGTDVGVITGALLGALGDANGNVASNACWALACQAKRADLSPAIAPLLEAAARGGAASPNARVALTHMLANEASGEAALAALGTRLADASPAVRQVAAYVLVAHAEAGGDLGPVFPALLAGLADPEESVRKECVWAVYCAMYAGRRLEAGELQTLERCLDDPSASVSGNGGIAVGLALLRADRRAEHAAMLEDDRRCFGAAWATVDHLLERGDPAPLEDVLGRIRPGIGARDQSLRQGIAGAIDHAASSGRDSDRAARAIQTWLSAQGDPVAEAAVMGIFYKLRQLRE